MAWYENRREMHREMLRPLIKNPAAGDAELKRVCERHSEGAKADDHIRWARRWLKNCIDIYERCEQGGEPPSRMDAVRATAWAIAKDPDLSDQQLLAWAKPRLNKVLKDPNTRIAKDYGPQMRDRLAAIARLSPAQRADIAAKLGQR